jgi:hypothetical protein
MPPRSAGSSWAPSANSTAKGIRNRIDNVIEGLRVPENVNIVIIAPVHPEDVYDLLWHGVWEATFDLGSFGVAVENLTTEQGDIQ